MPKVFCITENVTLAHLGRLISFSERFLAENFQIFFACSREAQKFVPQKYEYFEIQVLENAKFLKRLEMGTPLFTKNEIEDRVHEDLKLIYRIAPDVIVSDFRLSMQISARVTKIPFFNISSAHWRPENALTLPLPEMPLFRFLGYNVSTWLYKNVIPQFLIQRALKKQAGAFNQIRQIYALPVLKNICEVYSDGDYIIHPDPKNLFKTIPQTKSHFFIGPLLWEPQAENSICSHFFGSIFKSNRKTIYLSLGSSGNYVFFRPLLETLLKKNFNVLIATSAKFQMTNDYPEQLLILPYLSAKQIMPFCDLVICNGGSGTAYQALVYGVPVIGVVANVDQAWTMETLEKVNLAKAMRYWQWNSAFFENLIDRSIEEFQHDDVKQKCGQILNSETEIFEIERLQKLLKKANVFCV
jgi:UDP:flavonoid glycosyltransferase YjiC (YdhE family)